MGVDHVVLDRQPRRLLLRQVGVELLGLSNPVELEEEDADIETLNVVQG